MVDNACFNASFELQNYNNSKHDELAAKTAALDLPDNNKIEDKPDSKLLYSLEDVPPWYLSFFLGLQQFLTMLGSTVTLPFVLAPALCIGPDDPARAYLTCTIIFVSGIITFLQATFGVRLPIIQGGTFSLLIPTFAILNLPEWKCPEAGQHELVLNHTNVSDGSHKTITWHNRICEVQGAIIVATVFEVLMGLTGMVGFLLRFVTPLTITSVIALIGLALFETAAELASGNWAISMLTVFLLLLFSLYLREINVPFYTYNRGSGCKVVMVSLFKLFPVLLGIIVVWLLCFILTETDAISRNNPARTDIKQVLVDNTLWFRIPYPGQWGAPTVSIAGIFGMMGGLVASMLESVGNYNAAARLSGAPPPPMHAINRGIFMEGLGNVVAALWGTGNGTTSYAENIAVIGVTRAFVIMQLCALIWLCSSMTTSFVGHGVFSSCTAFFALIHKVGSRRVVQAAALIMIAFGTISKLGAVFVSVPAPVIGGVFFIMCSMIASVGLSNIQFVNMNSSRNLMVLGLPLFFGLAIPKWLATHKDAIQTGNVELDDVINVMLSTSMFVGGMLALILDNTVPATEDDRKVPVSSELCDFNVVSDDTPAACYDLPFGMNCLRKSSIAKYIPISPTYKQANCSCRKPTQSS